jgi:hypothetical protein
LRSGRPYIVGGHLFARKCPAYNVQPVKPLAASRDSQPDWVVGQAERPACLLVGVLIMAPPAYAKLVSRPKPSDRCKQGLSRPPSCGSMNSASYLLVLLVFLSFSFPVLELFLVATSIASIPLASNSDQKAYQSQKQSSVAPYPCLCRHAPIVVSADRRVKDLRAARWRRSASSVVKKNKQVGRCDRPSTGVKTSAARRSVRS